MRIQPIFYTPIQNRNTSYRKQQLGIQPPKNTGKDISFEAIRFPAFANTNMDQVVNIYKAMREYHLGITPAQARELDKKQGFDFAQGALDFLCDRFYIPRSIKPSLTTNTDEIPDAIRFISCLNEITIKQKYINFGEKQHVFAAVRHEFVHYMRNLFVFQHEEIGPKYIEELSDEVVSDMQIKIYDALQNPTKENLQKVEKNEYYKEKYDQVKKLYNQKKYSEIANLFFLAKFENIVKYKQFRENVIRRFGEVKKDSPMGSIIEQIYNERKATNYYNGDEMPDMRLYIKSKEEQAALTAQAQARFEYEMALKKPDIPETSRTGAISYLRFIANAKNENDLFEFRYLQQFIQ